ncbi:hypothetical protein NGC55_02615 [Staphylococcus xylosus]|uniref:hypothetical protein n=1 Tax=Staphylococcus xylosus TaxID=1288 RepID=UPI002DB7F9F7|nr:hypothetical protein [Staphylococcus xylosus]MEB7383776.1 hypothetical protein [Staphylococcus xylosus]
MSISKKKYEKLNNDLVDAKEKAFDDVKKALDDENKIMRLSLQIKQQRDQYKSERDSLIDDIAVIRANSERYRKRAENAMDYAERSQCEVMRLEGENEKQLELLKDFSKFINYKLIVSPASDTYKHYRSELDKLGVK